MVSRLAKHIGLQLLRHRCAVLPSLGGFVLEHVPARFDIESKLAHPPTTQVYFNEALTHHDGLMTESYAHQYGISLRRARIMLEEDIRSLRQTLVAQRHQTLEGLGMLSLGSEGQVIFTASAVPSAQLDALSYGLSSVSVPTVLVGEEPAEPETSHETRADDRQFVHLRIPRRALHYAAVVVLAMVALLLPWGHSVDQVESFTAGFAPSKQTVEVLTTTLTREEVPPTVQQEVAEPAASTGNRLAPVVGRHYVIAATERTQERIEQHYNRALTHEYPELGVLEGRRVYRLSVASFDTAAAAYRYSAQLAEGGVETWVYTHR